jgi:hypothetical protein
MCVLTPDLEFLKLPFGITIVLPKETLVPGSRLIAAGLYKTAEGLSA